MDLEVCVTWNDYQKKGKSIFRHLLESSEFADITLVSEDGQQFKGHKAILGSSCPFFEDLLRRNDHPHPLVHMFGVNSRELSALLNFLYKGESSILQEDLQAFIVLARKLNLTGLTKTQDLREDVFADAPKTKEADVKQSCKNVRTMRTSRCYFFWPLLIFGEKHAKNRQKHAKTGEKQALFWC